MYFRLLTINCIKQRGSEKNMKQKESKDIVVSFKLDERLYKKIKDLPDRSNFIRNAIEAAIEEQCPFCNGTGVLTKQQKEHFTNFLTNHSIARCPDCGANYIKCTFEKENIASGKEKNDNAE